MPLIDATYLQGNLTIGSNDPSVVLYVNNLIAMYENEYLQGTLGYSLMKALLAAPTEQRFIDLLNGKEYTYNNTVYYWQGLRNATTKRSPIANYVYYMYLKNTAQSQAGIGTVVPNAENATKTSPVDKMAFAWQDMVRVNLEMYQYLVANASVYPEFDNNIYYQNRRAQIIPPWWCKPFCDYGNVSQFYNPSYISRVW